ncbi:histone H3-like [Chironomus tepperi]|uniref:histone H3-like n=1 Tax=Chironomus tepperi TaxID=113505 RepID=UPI00391F8BCC
MVRTQAKASSSRNLLHESSDSEESESQPETSRSTRRAPRQPQRAQNTSSRSRKQSQPQNRQQQQQRNREQETAPPRRPQAGTSRETPLLRDIRILQQRPENNIIARAPFGRLLKEILQSHGDFRISKEAFDCIKEALEVYLVELFEDSYRLALHRKRVTLVPADMSLVLYLRGSRDPGYSVRN